MNFYKINPLELKIVIDLIIKNNFRLFLKKCFKIVNPDKEYMHNWHIDLIAEHLEACEKGLQKKLIINLPPRNLKSFIVNVVWPAWLLGKNPARRVISASYSQDLATKHSLDCRLIINSSWYKRLFPSTIIVKDHNQKDKFITTKRGFRLATSVGGTLTGEGGDFLILDDPHNPAHMYSKTMREMVLNWYDQVFATRLDDKENGVMVMIMQRLHVNDLTGYILSKNTSWNSLSIPAISQSNKFYQSPINKSEGYYFAENTSLHNEREGLDLLYQIRTELGNFTFTAQYLQNPLPLENGIIKRDWFRYYTAPPQQFLRIVQSWDTAIKSGLDNDYSACTTWGETLNAYYLLDVYRERLEFPTLKKMIINMAEKWRPNSVLIEDKASGGSLIQDIRACSKFPVIAIKPKFDKTARLVSISSLLESGRVMFPFTSSWMADFEQELLTFPNSVHDDMVDSFTQYLIWQINRFSQVPNIRRF